MEEVTRKLLEECSQGCKMAVGSMNQVCQHVNGSRLEDVILDYREKHEEIGKKADELLEAGGVAVKAPGAAATAYSWLSTEMKMRLNDDNSRISQILMDGCNMGIQNISGAMNQYGGASADSKKIARELVQTEEAFMKDLKEFL